MGGVLCLVGRCCVMSCCVASRHVMSLGGSALETISCGRQMVPHLIDLTVKVRRTARSEKQKDTNSRSLQKEVGMEQFTLHAVQPGPPLAPTGKEPTKTRTVESCRHAGFWASPTHESRSRTHCYTACRVMKNLTTRADSQLEEEPKKGETNRHVCLQ